MYRPRRELAACPRSIAVGGGRSRRLDNVGSVTMTSVDAARILGCEWGAQVGIASGYAAERVERPPALPSSSGLGYPRMSTRWGETTSMTTNPVPVAGTQCLCIVSTEQPCQGVSTPGWARWERLVPGGATDPFFGRSTKKVAVGGRQLSNPVVTVRPVTTSTAPDARKCTSLTVPRGQNWAENVHMRILAAENSGEKARTGGVTFLEQVPHRRSLSAWRPHFADWQED